MIIVKIMGGLGNQLFQYALGKHLAIKNNTILKLDISDIRNYNLRTFELPHFDITINLAENKDLPFQRRSSFLNRKTAKVWDILFSAIKIRKEKSLAFNPAVLEYQDNIYLDGYWQSEKYFEAVRDILVKELTIKSALNPIQTETAGLITKNNSVAVHIRRGDYVNHPIHPLCGNNYYQEAVALLSDSIDNPYFFIFSDDLGWCRTNFHIPYKHYFVSGNPPWVDFKLMTLCKHHIIANSTFSWWGAYLSSHSAKKVIAPKKWFNDNTRGMTCKDILPTEWIRL